MQKPISEFQKALEAVNGCKATLNCGCHMSQDDLFFARSLYIACRSFISSYDKHISRYE